MSKISLWSDRCKRRYKQTYFNQIWNLVGRDPRDAYMCQWSGQSRVHVMACRPIGASHYLNRCWLKILPRGPSVTKFGETFSSKKYIDKCRLHDVVHCVPASRILTHWRHMATQISVNINAKTYCLTTPSHYLKQCWHPISGGPFTREQFHG